MFHSIRVINISDTDHKFLLNSIRVIIIIIIIIIVGTDHKLCSIPFGLLILVTQITSFC